MPLAEYRSGLTIVKHGAQALQDGRFTPYVALSTTAGVFTEDQVVPFAEAFDRPDDASAFAFRWACANHPPADESPE